MRSCGGLDDASYRSAADVQSRGDFALTDSLREQRGDLRLMLLHRGGSSMRSAGFASLGDAGFDAISQDVALELRKDGEHAGERSTARGGHVQCFRKRDKADAEGAQLLQGANQVEERASPSIKAPDEDGIDLTPASGIHHRFSLGAAFGAGADLFNFRDDAPAAALGIGTQRRELGRERLLVMRRDAGIEPNPERCSPGQKPLQNGGRVIAHFPGFATSRPGMTDNYSFVPHIGTLLEEAPPPIAMEACAGAHHWARGMVKLGHTVKIMSPQFVKPYVKGNKTDRNDAAAICEAAGRPDMRFVPVKSVDQQQILVFHRVRRMLVGQRTQVANQVRGLLAEFGVSIPVGLGSLRRRLPEILEDAENDVPALVRPVLADEYQALRGLDERIKEMNKQIERFAQQSEPCRRLMGQLGVGALGATCFVASVGAAQGFKNGRQVAAWLGLVPRLKFPAASRDKIHV